MSYSFSCTAKSCEEAKAEFAEAFNVPEPVQQEVNAILDRYQANGVELVDVSCYGHHPNEGEKGPGNSGSCHITVTVIQ